MRKQTFETVSVTPDSNKSSEDYFGSTYVYEEVHKNQIFQAFNLKCKALNNICAECCLDVGAAQAMIGKFWTQIKYGEFDTIINWIKNNYFRQYQILSPDYHTQVMDMRNGAGAMEYQSWFNKKINNF